MPMPIVDDQYGPPHRYGSTAWDVFRPNPTGEAKLQKELYGSGFVGTPAETVTEERSPFVKLLQGVGLVGETQPRPLTTYEQMLVELGKHAKSDIDLQTEEQRQRSLERQLGLAEEYVKETGQEPQGSYLEAIDPSIRAGLPSMVELLQSKILYDQQLRDLNLRNIQSEIDYRSRRAGMESTSIEDQRHQNLLNAWARNPLNFALIKRYTAERDAAFDAEDPIEQRMHLNKMLEIQQQLGKSNMDFMLEVTGGWVDPMAAFPQKPAAPPATENRLYSNVPSIEGALKAFGLGREKKEK